MERWPLSGGFLRWRHRKGMFQSHCHEVVAAAPLDTRSTPFLVRLGMYPALLGMLSLLNFMAVRLTFLPQSFGPKSSHKSSPKPEYQRTAAVVGPKCPLIESETRFYRALIWLPTRCG